MASDAKKKQEDNTYCVAPQHQSKFRPNPVKTMLKEVDIADAWGLVGKFCIFLLACDLLGCVVLSRRRSGVRWWGSYEKMTVTVVPIMVVISAYMIIVPLWMVLIPEENQGGNGRYLPQDDLDDELEEKESNPTSYQVWKDGSLVFASTRKTEVRDWLTNTRNVARGNLPDLCVREVSL
eukprot:gene24-81_t